MTSCSSLPSRPAFGYFKNFGETRRQGLELGASGRVGRVTIGTGYTYLNATFQSEETVNGESNSTNEAAEAGARGLEGTIEIEPGDRIPLVPPHMLKVYADVQATSALSLDFDLIAVSSSYARGNENNLHEPDDTYYLGPGSAPALWRPELRSHLSAQALAAAARADQQPLRPPLLHGRAARAHWHLQAPGRSSRRPFPAVNGEFPVRQATFYAPGAPLKMWIGTRFTF